MEYQRFVRMKNVNSGFLMIVFLLISFFALSGNQAFSSVQQQKFQTELVLAVKGLKGKQVNFYDKKPVAKNAHFPARLRFQNNVLFAMKRTTSTKLKVLRLKRYHFRSLSYFEQLKVISKTGEDDHLISLAG